MVASMDAARAAAEVARGVGQLAGLGLLTADGRAGTPVDRLAVARDSLRQTETGALAGYGAADTHFALDVWRQVVRLYESRPGTFEDLDNRALAEFLAAVRRAHYGPQVTSALARWIAPRMFISATYTAEQLERLRPSGPARPSGT